MFALKLILFVILLPTIYTVEVCLGKGIRNTTDGLCSCITGYHGANCEYKYCPFGSSWWSAPVTNNKRNSPNVECSDMGHCDWRTGKCICRDGYEGRACERISCLGGTAVAHTYSNISAYYVGSPGTIFISPHVDAQTVTTCSGHGVCRSLRQMANEFNGLSLVRPPMDYYQWDADRIQGCLCDPGWDGPDCSLRTCPRGRDPTSSSFVYDREEVFVMQCHADAGYFTIFALGQYTPPIPYDADPGYLRYALESLNQAGSVTVKMHMLDTTAEPTVCGPSDFVTTEITFDDYIGQRPPIMINKNASATRQWPDATSLSLSGGSAGLRMQTLHTLTCDACLNCYGTIYFAYQNSISDPINVNQAGVESRIKAAILGLADLVNTRWTNLAVNVSVVGTSEKICNVLTATTTTISLYSDYGNIPFLTLIDGTRHSRRDTASTPANLTYTTNSGNGTLYECSNQGTCDITSGICTCFVQVAYTDIQYQLLSSNNKLSSGDRGDCSYVATPLPACFLEGKDLCNGHGYCSNVTAACVCSDGWSGITCTVRECPKGRAFADEPLLPGYAHQLEECSGMGTCDRAYGLCHCQAGFVGAACDIRDCVRDTNTGEPCHGHGACLSTAQYFRQHGFTYGDLSGGEAVDFGANWDADTWHECVCSAKISGGYPGDQRRPSVGPASLVSGTVSGSAPLPGWGNWDCTLRNCPKGDIVSRRNNYGGVVEIQRVVCHMYTSKNTSDYFILGIMGQQSERIYTDYTLSQIALAVQYPAVVGNVTITFPNFIYDDVATACHEGFNKTDGGFLVQFNTELGNIPLMTNVLNSNITILPYQDGTNANLECGGSTMGFCDRITGTCVCNGHQASSNGTGSPGALGDCGYNIDIPLSTDSATVFNYLKKDDF